MPLPLFELHQALTGGVLDLDAQAIVIIAVQRFDRLPVRRCERRPFGRQLASESGCLPCLSGHAIQLAGATQSVKIMLFVQSQFLDVTVNCGRIQINGFVVLAMGRQPVLIIERDKALVADHGKSGHDPILQPCDFLAHRHFGRARYLGQCRIVVEGDIGVFRGHVEPEQLATFQHVGVAVGSALQAIDILDACVFPALRRRVPTLDATGAQTDQTGTVEVQAVGTDGRRHNRQSACVVQDQRIGQVPAAFQFRTLLVERMGVHLALTIPDQCVHATVIAADESADAVVAAHWLVVQPVAGSFGHQAQRRVVAFEGAAISAVKPALRVCNK